MPALPRVTPRLPEGVPEGLRRWRPSPPDMDGVRRGVEELREQVGALREELSRLRESLRADDQ